MERLPAVFGASGLATADRTVDLAAEVLSPIRWLGTAQCAEAAETVLAAA
jgi:hypothetical protein